MLFLAWPCTTDAGELLNPYAFSSSRSLLASEANSNFQVLSGGIVGLENRLRPRDAVVGSWSGIPHTFEDGTRGKASEIRENYEAVASGINTVRHRIQRQEQNANSDPWGGVPHIISAGQPLTDTTLNENFDALFAELNALQARVAALEGSIANRPPTASFTVSPTSGDVDTPFQWNASSSHDAEDSYASLQVRWDWESDGTWDTAYSSAKAVSHAFTAAGTYSVRLQVQDVAGLTATTTHTVVVAVGLVAGEIEADRFEPDDTREQAQVIVVDDAQPQRHDIHRSGDEDWVQFFAISGEQYVVWVQHVGHRLDPVLALYDATGKQVPNLPGNEGTVGEEEWFRWTAPADGIYFVHVSSSGDDQHGEASNYELFITQSMAGLIGFVNGTVLDLMTRAPIALARIQTNGSTGALSMPQGAYVMAHRSGSFQVTATAEGYRTFTDQIVVTELNITTFNIFMTPNETPPTASLTILPSSGDTNTDFQFDASGSSDEEDPSSALQVRWDWDGDSTWDTEYASIKTASHTFLAAGTHTVRVQVKDSADLTQTIMREVVVETPNQPPTAFFTISPTSGNPTTNFQFDASGSVDAEDPITALQVRWDWDGDNIWDTDYASIKTASHSFTAAGTYTVGVQVKDSGGLTGSITRQVVVKTPNQPPTAFFTISPTSGNTTTTFQLDASGSVDAEDPITALQVRWDWDGDSTWDTDYASIKTASHSFTAAGTYTVGVQVKDSGGLTGSITRQVVVKTPNQPPTAFFTISPTSGNTTTTFQLDASGSVDAEDPITALQVRWDWDGDSTWDTDYASIKTASHSFTAAGTYTVGVQVKDSGGLTKTITRQVVVETSNQPPTASFTISPTSGNTGVSKSGFGCWPVFG